MRFTTKSSLCSSSPYTHRLRLACPSSHIQPPHAQTVSSVLLPISRGFRYFQVFPATSVFTCPLWSFSYLSFEHPWPAAPHGLFVAAINDSLTVSLPLKAFIIRQCAVIGYATTMPLYVPLYRQHIIIILLPIVFHLMPLYGVLPAYLFSDTPPIMPLISSMFSDVFLLHAPFMPLCFPL